MPVAPCDTGCLQSVFACKQGTQRMNDKSTVVSLRISASLRQKLGVEAENNGLSLTEHIRTIISDTQGEKRLSSARQDVHALEYSAQELSTHITRMTERQKKLFDEMNNRQDQVFRDIENKGERISMTLERIGNTLWKDRFLTLLLTALILLSVSTGGAFLGMWYYGAVIH